LTVIRRRHDVGLLTGSPREKITNNNKKRQKHQKKNSLAPAETTTDGTIIDDSLLSPPVTAQLQIKRQDHSLIIDSLKQEIALLNNKVDSLNDKVTKIESSLTQTEASLAISQMTSKTLRREVDRLQQYSRRNCIIVDGIPLSRGETPTNQQEKAFKTITTEFPDDDEVVTSLDKAHRIGPVKNGKQSMIIRFNKHSVVRRVYNRRKSGSGLNNKAISLRPSLTSTRISCLKKCQQLVESTFSKIVKFVFADIEGNLKKEYRGRNVHIFLDEDDLMDILLMTDHKSEFPFSSDRDNNNDEV